MKICPRTQAVCADYECEKTTAGCVKPLEYFTPPPVQLGEWQLCPKCHGDGNLLRYNSPAMMGTNYDPVCDVCKGEKIIKRPLLTH